jgi:translocation and assembly module TamB
MQVVDGTAAAVPFTRAGVDVKLADRRAVVTGRVEEPNGSALTIDGGVPVGEEDGTMDLRVLSSGVSLGLAAAFTTHLEAIQGVANLDMHVGGTFAAPELNGTVGLADAAFTVTATGVRYQNVLFDVRLAGDTLSIERGSLADEDGHVMTMSGTGNVLGADGRTIDVQVQSEQIHVLGNELGEVELTIDARAQGNLMSPNVTGRIVVNRGRLEVDELLARFATPGAAIVPPPTTPGPAAPGTPTTPAPADAAVAHVDATDAPQVDGEVALAETTASNSTIEIEVELPDNVVLRGDDIKTAAGSLGLGNLNMTVGGGFVVRKESGVPVRLVGAVEVIRGFYEFQGRRFEVEEGSEIRFRGPESSNPELDVTGQREVSGITARVEVTGTARRPRISLSSQPPLDEGDVLSLIIFNQPMSQLGQSEQVDLMDRAGDMALGALATTLADSIGQALDVDLFEIRAPSSGGAGEVALGTQVSDRLFVGFRQEFGSDSASRLSFEYRLTEFLRLLTSVGQGADQSRATRDRETAGLDLVFRVRY